MSTAVHLANVLITTQRVKIRDGRSQAKECHLAANVDITQQNLTLKHRGWARHPQRGAQYGQTYVEPCKKDIRETFDCGACVSTDKMSPCAMLESLQLLYPGQYTLPGENEIRTEITRFFGRKKGSNKHDIGSVDSENDDGTHGRKGDKAIYPRNT